MTHLQALLDRDPTTLILAGVFLTTVGLVLAYCVVEPLVSALASRIRYGPLERNAKPWVTPRPPM